MRIVIRRVTFSNEGPTYGVLLMHGIPVCVTLERPWFDNKPNISCIPPGVYECVRHNSADHPDTWEVTGVPDRTAILIHTGNTSGDSQGCILVGKVFCNGGILNSTVAMNELRHTLPAEGFTLEIVNPTE